VIDAEQGLEGGAWKFISISSIGYVHVLADALTSVPAIIALLAGRFYGWICLIPS
jgi:hypothetical protein